MATAVLLGTGTSNGVPNLGRTYSPGFLAQPKNHRTRCALALLGPEGNVLVDCGPEVRLQLLREGVGDVDSVIVTHTHADHIMGMDDLRSFCIRDERAMPVYALEPYHDDLRRVFAYAFLEFPAGIWVPKFDLRPVTPVLHLCGLEIVTFVVEHGSWPVVALRVGSFAYVTDVSRIPEDGLRHLRGLRTLVLDAVRVRPHPNHFHFDRAVEVAQEIGAERTYLTHLSDDFDHEATNRGLPPSVRLAYDGLRIEL